MKKSLISVLSILFILGLCAMPLSANTEAKDQGYISVNMSKNTQLEPDISEISFCVKTSDKQSMQKATEENKLITQKVINDLKSKINTVNGDYIKTSNYSANPIYNYKDSKKIFERYEVSNTILVHTKSINSVGKMIDSSINSGATSVSNLSFSLSNYDSQCNKLLVSATKDAKQRANEIATALGTSLNGVRSLDTSCSTNSSSYPRAYMARSLMATSNGASDNQDVPIESGTIKLNANVNVTFFVK